MRILLAISHIHKILAVILTLLGPVMTHQEQAARVRVSMYWSEFTASNKNSNTYAQLRVDKSNCY